MALPVEIVRPKGTFSGGVSDLIYSIVETALRAWFLMLLVPVVWKPLGYWHCVALIIVIGSVIGDTSGHRLWTRDAR